MNSWFAFERAAQDIVSKTITLNLTSERAVLDKTLFRGNELIRGGSDPYHVLRVFTKLLPNARGVSKETLDSDQAALKAIFKASGGTKAVAGPGFGVVGGGTSFYNLLYVGMIFFFCYFWTAITFNPKEMSDNLRDSGTFIPGYRPGRRTTDYLEKVMVRITYVGAAFLAIVAIVPTIVYGSLGVPYSIAGFYGGTGLLIAVSVAFDLVQKIDSHLVMRNYRGLLEGAGGGVSPVV